MNASKRAAAKPIPTDTTMEGFVRSPAPFVVGSDHELDLGSLLVSKLACGDNSPARGALRTVASALLVIKDAQGGENGGWSTDMDRLMWGLYEFATLAVEVDQRIEDARREAEREAVRQ